MAQHVTEALIVHCIDFRFQKYLDTWLQEHLGHGNYDRVSLAGGVFDFDTISEQVRISVRLHEIDKVVLVNHEDCGAYGDKGNFERHQNDLRVAKQTIDADSPGLKVEIYYLRLEGVRKYRILKDLVFLFPL